MIHVVEHYLDLEVSFEFLGVYFGLESDVVLDEDFLVGRDCALLLIGLL